MSARAGTAPERRVDAIRLAAVLSVAAGAAHLSVSRLHFDEYALIGVFFAVCGLLQLAWPVLVWNRGDDRRLVLGGVALQLAIAFVWLVSRTIGLPYGEHPWQAESIGPLDAQVTADELVIAAVAVLALRDRRGDGPLGGALEVLAVLCVAATWLMIVAGADHGH